MPNTESHARNIVQPTNSEERLTPLPGEYNENPDYRSYDHHDADGG